MKREIGTGVLLPQTKEHQEAKETRGGEDGSSMRGLGDHGPAGTLISNC